MAVPDHRTRSIRAAQKGRPFRYHLCQSCFEKELLAQDWVEARYAGLLAGNEEFAAEKQEFAVREYISKNNPCRHFFVYTSSDRTVITPFTAGVVSLVSERELRA